MTVANWDAEDITTNEQNAERRIAESLGNVFKIIGELSSGISDLSGGHATETSRNFEGSTSTPVTSVPPPGPPPGSLPYTPRQGLGYPVYPPPPPTIPGSLPATAFYQRYAPQVPPPPPPAGAYFAPPPTLGTVPIPPPPPPVPIGQTESAPASAYPWGAVPYPAQVQRSNTWGGIDARPYAPPMGDPFGSNGGDMDAHELKARLEAAKAVYKEEKERYQQEKEKRRRMRQEISEKRREEGLSR